MRAVEDARPYGVVRCPRIARGTFTRNPVRVIISIFYFCITKKLGQILAQAFALLLLVCDCELCLLVEEVNLRSFESNLDLVADLCV